MTSHGCFLRYFVPLSWKMYINYFLNILPFWLVFFKMIHDYHILSKTIYKWLLLELLDMISLKYNNKFLIIESGFRCIFTVAFERLFQIRLGCPAGVRNRRNPLLRLISMILHICLDF